MPLDQLASRHQGSARLSFQLPVLKLQAEATEPALYKGTDHLASAHLVT